VSTAFDVVVVYHNQRNHNQTKALFEVLSLYADRTFNFIPVDNRKTNRGFAPGCNYGALRGSSPLIGFLNPDVLIGGSFLGLVEDALSDPAVVITGERFGKPQWEIDMWGCRDWVCGAAFFVKRDWFDAGGGFDPRYTWGWEETDLIRRAQQENRLVRSIDLPLEHASPSDDTPEDSSYKNFHFTRGAHLFRTKWQGGFNG
jgi:GT2 family glycosyltransferase